MAEYRQADGDMLNELAEMVRIREDVVQKDELKEANNRPISQPYLPVGGSSRQQATDVINMRDPETGKLVKAGIVTNAKGVTQVRYLCDDCTKAKGKEMYHSKGFKGCVNHQNTTTVGQAGTHNRGGQQGGGGGKTEGCWNKCGQNGHMYTECSKPITDPWLLKRLQVNQRERERRVAFAKQMGWELDSSTGLPKHDKAPRGGASSATAGPDLQQLLEKLDKVSTDLETLKQKGKAAVSESPHPPNRHTIYADPFLDSTDDEGVSRIDLTHEYQRAVETYALAYADIKQFSRNALLYSFLPGKDLSSLGCEEILQGKSNPGAKCKRRIEKSEKARMQLDLEKRFIEFEKQYNN